MNQVTLLDVWICVTGLQHTPSYYTSFTNKASFTKGGINNSHTWSRGNPHEARGTNFQETFLVNVWCGLLVDKLIEMFVSGSNLTSDTREFLLWIELPSLWEDILLMVGGQMYFHHDGASPHYTWHMTEYLEKSFPNLWLGRGRPLAWPPRLRDLNASWLLSLEPHECISVWNKGWFGCSTALCIMAVAECVHDHPANIVSAI